MNQDLVTQYLEAKLPTHEGNRLRVYDDGNAQNIIPGSRVIGYATIGTGRNLVGKGITNAERLYLLDNDIKDVYAQLDRVLPWWRNLDEVTAYVLADMCFNMGISRLQGFPNFLSALRNGDKAKAIAEMKNSKWWTQVGNRAVDLANSLQTGRSPV